jgi:hypothetical protein
MRAGLAPTLEAEEAKRREACAISTRVAGAGTGEEVSHTFTKTNASPVMAGLDHRGVSSTIQSCQKSPYGHNLSVG